MTTPNTEELIEEYWEIAYSEGKLGVSRGTQAGKVLGLIRAYMQSQAERIKELEGVCVPLSEYADLALENDTLRAQLAAIAATEPVAWMFDEAKYHENDLRGRQWMPKISRHIPAVPWMQRNVVPLFTRPMPAQDVTELVDALEKLARLGNGEHYGNSDGNMIARDALSKYKGAK